MSQLWWYTIERRDRKIISLGIHNKFKANLRNRYDINRICLKKKCQKKIKVQYFLSMCKTLCSNSSTANKNKMA